MRFERLSGRRIVPHLLALLHLSMTCHQSGHIPPPAESKGGWPLSFASICHSLPACLCVSSQRPVARPPHGNASKALMRM